MDGRRTFNRYFKANRMINDELSDLRFFDIEYVIQLIFSISALMVPWMWMFFFSLFDLHGPLNRVSIFEITCADHSDFFFSVCAFILNFTGSGRFPTQ